VKSFSEFLLAEKMNETGLVAPVGHYFSHAPVTYLQHDIPRILDLLKKGKLHPVQKTMRLADLTPTQDVINLEKVYRKYRAGDDPDHAVVVLHDRGTGQDFIIDGHHRASALALGSVVSTKVTVIDSLDVARYL
jgi:hypothetical protein